MQTVVSESEAINELLGEFEGSQNSASEANSGKLAGADDAANEAKSDGADGKNSEQDANKNEAQNGEIAAINKQLAALAEMVKELKEAKTSQPNKSDFASASSELEGLGLNAASEQIKGITDKFAAIEQTLKNSEEIAKNQEIFSQNVASLKKDFGEIDINELAKWAKENGVMSLLNTPKYESWKALARLFTKINRVKPSSDEITKNSGANSATTLEKLNKGESVSDIEIGAMLLAEIGG